MQEPLKDLLETGHVICISEGSAEEVIIKKLFESNKLIFENGDIYGEDKLIRKFSRTRQAKKFGRENLEMDYGDRTIYILRILDSKVEDFNLGTIYEERVKSGEIQVINILTRPEIEMLIIINEDHYQKFTNKKGSISANGYCKIELNMNKVKSAVFVSEYFSDIEILINSIKKYRELHFRKDEHSLFDLLK